MPPTQTTWVFSGFQSVPKPYGKAGFEISAWHRNGNLESPRFGQTFTKEDFQSNKEIHFVLEYPSEVKLESLVGPNGSLVVDLEVDARKENGWTEEVFFLEGSR